MKPFLVILASALVGSALVISWSSERPQCRAKPIVSNPVSPVRGPVSVSPEEVRRKLRERTKTHLDWAESECQRAISEQVKHFGRYLAGVKDNTPALADEVLGWGSKWRLITDHIPFIGTDQAHEEFIRDAFHKHLFTKEGLEAQVRSVVKNYLESVKGVESQMLVKIRQDIGDLPQGVIIFQVNKDKLHELLEKAMSLARDRAGAELREEAAKQIVSLVVGEVLAHAAVRLGVSGGILSTGAASGWVTFGVGVVAGVVVDQAVSMVWDLVADPRGELARTIALKIDEIQEAIVEGTSSAPGMRIRLEQLARERAVARRSAILDLIDKNGVQP